MAFGGEIAEIRKAVDQHGQAVSAQRLFNQEARARAGGISTKTFEDVEFTVVINDLCSTNELAKRGREATNCKAVISKNREAVTMSDLAFPVRTRPQHTVISLFEMTRRLPVRP